MLEEEHHNFSFNPLIKKFMSWKVIHLNEPSNEGGITIIKHLAQLCCVLVNERTHFQFFCFSEKKKKREFRPITKLSWPQVCRRLRGTNLRWPKEWVRIFLLAALEFGVLLKLPPPVLDVSSQYFHSARRSCGECFFIAIFLFKRFTVSSTTFRPHRCHFVPPLLCASPSC